MKNFHFLFIFIVALLQWSCRPSQPTGMLAESPLIEKSQLPKEVTESSGLALVSDKIWTLNDSGNHPELYQVGLDKTITLQTVKVEESTNRDWEELASDDQYLYIGDFGNNGGNRQDLTIYKMGLTDLAPSASRASPLEKMIFKFSDQNHFEHEAYQHNVDCEAMIALGDYLYLFSKNHLDQKCNLYQLSKRDSTGIATRIDSFDTHGTITAADYSAESNALALLGYVYHSSNDIPVFVWLFHGFEETDFFSGKADYINVKLNAQAEGIVFLNQSELLISTEAEGGGVGMLYSLDIKDWLE